MNIYTNFYKLLLFVVLLCICAILIFKIKEKFTGNTPNKCNVIVSTNNNKNKLILRWSKVDEITVGYVIVMFKNNDGPYFIYPDKFIDINSNDYIYNYMNPTMNVRYKFAIVGYDSHNVVSPIEKFSEVMLTPNGLDLKYVDSAYSKVTCFPDGSFHIGDKCVASENIQAIEKDNGTDKDFSVENHANLMRDLSNKQTINFNF